MRSTKKIKMILVTLLVLVVFVVFFAIWWGTKRKQATHSRVVPEFNMEQLTRGRVSSNSLASMMNHSSIKKSVKVSSPHKKVVKKRTYSSSHNSRKDEEILMKYASVRRRGSSMRGASGIKKQVRSGGVFVIGAKKDATKPIALHNVKIKVKLTLSIRSSSRTPVIAEVVSAGQKVAKGTKFIGAPTAFSNRRTQIRFSQMRLDGNRTAVEGFAISGKDPGIPSEVTDISSNVNKTVHAGAIKSVTSLAAGVVGGFGGGAASAANNMISPAGNEVASQKESAKMRQEFRVPAGTIFYIYLE